MALPLKTAGLRELEALRRRLKRQHALERIDPADYLYILGKVDEIEARIQRMREEVDDADAYES